MTSPIEAALLVAVLAGGFHLVIMFIADRLDDPAYLRGQGVVIVREEVLTPSSTIGTYMGHPVWESVRFKGMEYRFSRITPASYRERIEAGELYLEPGLVYALK